MEASNVWNAGKNLRNEVRTHRLSAKNSSSVSGLSELVPFKAELWKLAPRKFPFHSQHKSTPGKLLGMRCHGCSL